MDSSTRRRRRGARIVVAGLGAALLLTGCGFNAQTLQPYTPAQGVNVDTGDVKVRNLVLVSDDEGRGIVSASLISSRADQLTGIQGTPIKDDGTPGAPLTVSGGEPVDLPANQLVVLTNPQPVLSVSSPDLEPGMIADLTLTFASGATTSLRAPVMGYDDPIYETISPAPASPTASPAASATAAPSPGATPTPGTTPAVPADGTPTPTPTATP